MELSSYRVNIDFEYQLFDPSWSFQHPKFRKICRELEWVYFYLGQEGSSLSTDINYDPSFISSVEDITGKRIKTIPLSEGVTPWWGSSTNPLEKEWNSKITSFKISKELGLLPSGSKIVTHWEELETAFSEGDVIKSPFEFSGRGFSRKLDKNQSFPLILEPWEERVLDFGLRIDLRSGEMTIVENFVDSLGQFKGGRLNQEFSSQIDQKIIQQIVEAYKERGIQDFVQMDCYQTASGVRYLVEMNHRKTMGDFISTLSFNHDFKDSSFFFLNSKEAQKLKQKKIQYRTLSPAGTYFECIVVMGVKKDEVKEILS
jgi:hypothetical protein